MEDDGLYDDEISTPKRPKGWGKRHTQTLLGCLLNATTACNVFHLTIAIVAMTTPGSGNSTVKVFDWSPKVQGLIFSSFTWGTLIIQIPAGMVIQKYGWKIPTICALFAMGFLSFVFPILTIWGGAPMACVCRAVHGTMHAVIFPAVSTIVGKWAPLNERATSITYSMMGNQLGSICLLAISGYLLTTSIGWPLIFYISGAISFIMALLVIWLGFETPWNHPKISKEEIRYVMNAKPPIKHVEKQNTPWKEIFTSIPFWSLMIANGGNIWAVVVFWYGMPTYLNHIMGVNLKANGLLSALPYLAMAICKVTYSNVFDWLIRRGTLSVTPARKISNTIGMWGGGIALICFSLVPSSNLSLAIVLLVTTFGLHAGATMGYLLSTIDIAPNLAGITTAITSITAILSSMLSPIVLGFIVYDYSEPLLWKYGFGQAAAVLFIVNLIYLIWGTSEVQPWNEPSHNGTLNKEDAKELEKINDGPIN